MDKAEQGKKVVLYINGLSNKELVEAYDDMIYHRIHGYFRTTMFKHLVWLLDGNDEMAIDVFMSRCARIFYDQNK